MGSLNLLKEANPLQAEDTASGNLSTLSNLLEEARPVVYRYAVRRTSDVDDAEDITQLVLLQVLSGISNYRGESRFSSWLYRITSNEAAGFYRRRVRGREIEQYSCEKLNQTISRPDVIDLIEFRRLKALVRELSSCLPPLQQLALRLVDLDGYRPCEVARLLGRTQPTIRSSLCRARKKIRELLLDRGFGAASHQQTALD